MDFLVKNEQWSALEKVRLRVTHVRREEEERGRGAFVYLLISFLNFLIQLVQRLEGIQPVPFEYGRGVVLETQLLQDVKGCALLNMGKYDNASDVLANVASYVSYLFWLSTLRASESTSSFLYIKFFFDIDR